MTGPGFSRLADLKPAENQTARRRAISAGLSAFDAAGEKKPAPTQGIGVLQRLTSIFNEKSRRWTMERRLAFGTLAAGILLVPLTAQLVKTTSFSPPEFNNGQPPALEKKELRTPKKNDTAADNSSKTNTSSEPALESSDLPTGPEAPVAQVHPAPVLAPARPGSQALADKASGRVRGTKIKPMMAPPASQTFMAQRSQDTSQIGVLHPEPPQLVHQDNSRFETFQTNTVTAVADQPVSTFSIDVDTTSYAFVRRTLEAGQLPTPEMVRVEEMINYFDYDYPGPDTIEQPFKASIAVYPTPWNSQTQLLHIGIKGHHVAPATKPQTNLVLLIDVSGSMNQRDKLPLLKSAFRLLLSQLEPNDTVAIVTYAGAAGTVLEPTRVKERARILAALDGLGAGGSTAGVAGIQAAYDLARANYIKDGVNRVILATDGDFNIGISDPKALKTLIARERRDGVMLSVLGFGQGNYNDQLMQALAQNGNGTAAYIDTLREAHKVLVAEAGATLYPIAKDVKIQVEFNPARISEYRLIGYETRALARVDFNNDKVDAGDIGSGHTVTAIYEITPTGSQARLTDDLRYQKHTERVPEAGGEIAFLKIRYKAPKASTSQLITRAIGEVDRVADFSQLPADKRFAVSVAAFGQKLRGVPQLEDFGMNRIAEMAGAARGPDPFGYRAEFISLVRLAASLDPDIAQPSNTGDVKQ